MQLLYCRDRLFVSCIFYHGYYSKSFANVSERRLHARLNIARHFFYTRTRVPHARHACLVLDFSEPNCDWSKKNYVMEIVCGFVFADVIFRRSEATAGNTSAYVRSQATGQTATTEIKVQQSHSPKTHLKYKAAGGKCW